MAEVYKYFDAANIEELADIIDVDAQDALKYIYNNYATSANEEDLKYFNDDVRAAFKSLRDSCLAFVNAYDFCDAVYTTKLPSDVFEQVKELSIRNKNYAALKEEHFVKVLK